MPRGRPVPRLSLTAEERETLERWARRPKTARALALRARIVLVCAEGNNNTAVSARMQVCKQTVGKWRNRTTARLGSVRFVTMKPTRGNNSPKWNSTLATTLRAVFQLAA